MIDSIPEMNSISHKMNGPDEILEVYFGPIYFKINNEVIKFENVRIELVWQPQIAYYFEFNTNKEWVELGFDNNTGFEYSINNTNFYFTSIFQRTEKYVRFSSRNLEIGSRPLIFKEVYFEIPNFQLFRGLITKEKNEFKPNRIKINNDLSEIRIDTLKINNTGKEGHIYYNRYYVNARGHILFNEPISYETLMDFCNALNYFLSFVNGRWTSIFFVEIPDSKYKIYSSPFIQPFCSQTPTFDLSFTKGCIDGAFKNFRALWSDENNKRFIKRVIEWYTEISIAQIQFEKYIILSQATLELMFNHLSRIKFRSEFTRRELESMKIYRKIIFLCEKFKIKTDLPQDFYDNFLELSSEDIKDIPNLITECRNVFVHRNVQEKIYTLNGKQIKYIHDLASAYVEIVLIKLLEVKLPLNERLKKLLISEL